MCAKNSVQQFVKDGLVGAAVVIVIFGVLFIPLFASMPIPPGQADGGPAPSRYIALVLSLLISPTGVGFINPIPFVILAAFIGSGLGATSIEHISSRKGWIKPMIIVNLLSWLIGGIVFSELFIVALMFTRGIPPEVDAKSFFEAFFTVTGAILRRGSYGAIAGCIIGCLAGLIFNPGRRLYRIMIVSVSIALVSLGNGIGLFMIQGSS